MSLSKMLEKLHQLERDWVEASHKRNVLGNTQARDIVLGIQLAIDLVKNHLGPFATKGAWGMTCVRCRRSLMKRSPDLVQ